MSPDPFDSDVLPLATSGDSAGVGWYSPALFRALRKAGVPLAPSCADWDAWFTCYQTAFVRLKEAGFRPNKIAVDPGDLARWLASIGREHSIEAHWDYVSWRLERLVMEDDSP